jgi:hypothetical protein
MGGRGRRGGLRDEEHVRRVQLECFIVCRKNCTGLVSPSDVSMWVGNRSTDSESAGGAITRHLLPPIRDRGIYDQPLMAFLNRQSSARYFLTRGALGLVHLLPILVI